MQAGVREGADDGGGRAGRGNLPVTVTRFVGRRRELAEVRRLIAQSRLVTLTGVGGVGKTRLATEAAARLGSAFPGGTWMADLSAVVDGGQAAQAVVNALGVVDRSTRPATDKIIGHFARGRGAAGAGQLRAPGSTPARCWSTGCSARPAASGCWPPAGGRWA